MNLQIVIDGLRKKNFSQLLNGKSNASASANGSFDVSTALKQWMAKDRPKPLDLLAVLKALVDTGKPEMARFVDEVMMLLCQQLSRAMSSKGSSASKQQQQQQQQQQRSSALSLLKMIHGAVRAGCAMPASSPRFRLLIMQTVLLSPSLDQVMDEATSAAGGGNQSAAIVATAAELVAAFCSQAGHLARDCRSKKGVAAGASVALTAASALAHSRLGRWCFRLRAGLGAGDDARAKSQTAWAALLEQHNTFSSVCGAGARDPFAHAALAWSKLSPVAETNGAVVGLGARASVYWCAGKRKWTSSSDIESALVLAYRWLKVTSDQLNSATSTVVESEWPVPAPVPAGITNAVVSLLRLAVDGGASAMESACGRATSKPSNGTMRPKASQLDSMRRMVEHGSHLLSAHGQSLVSCAAGGPGSSTSFQLTRAVKPNSVSEASAMLCAAVGQCALVRLGPSAAWEPAAVLALQFVEGALLRLPLCSSSDSKKAGSGYQLALEAVRALEAATAYAANRCVSGPTTDAVPPPSSLFDFAERGSALIGRALAAAIKWERGIPQADSDGAKRRPTEFSRLAQSGCSASVAFSRSASVAFHRALLHGASKHSAKTKGKSTALAAAKLVEPVLVQATDSIDVECPADRDAVAVARHRLGAALLSSSTKPSRAQLAMARDQLERAMEILLACPIDNGGETASSSWTLSSRLSTIALAYVVVARQDTRSSAIAESAVEAAILALQSWPHWRCWSSSNTPNSAGNNVVPNQLPNSVLRMLSAMDVDQFSLLIRCLGRSDAPEPPRHIEGAALVSSQFCLTPLEEAELCQMWFQLASDHSEVLLEFARAARQAAVFCDEDLPDSDALALSWLVRSEFAYVRAAAVSGPDNDQSSSFIECVESLNTTLGAVPDDLLATEPLCSAVKYAAAVTRLFQALLDRDGSGGRVQHLAVSWAIGQPWTSSSHQEVADVFFPSWLHAAMAELYAVLNPFTSACELELRSLLAQSSVVQSPVDLGRAQVELFLRSGRLPDQGWPVDALGRAGYSEEQIACLTAFESGTEEGAVAVYQYVFDHGPLAVSSVGEACFATDIALVAAWHTTDSLRALHLCRHALKLARRIAASADQSSDLVANASRLAAGGRRNDDSGTFVPASATDLAGPSSWAAVRRLIETMTALGRVMVVRGSSAAAEAVWSRAMALATAVDARERVRVLACCRAALAIRRLRLTDASDIWSKWIQSEAGCTSEKLKQEPNDDHFADPMSVWTMFEACDVAAAWREIGRPEEARCVLQFVSQSLLEKVDTGVCVTELLSDSEKRLVSLDSDNAVSNCQDATASLLLQSRLAAERAVVDCNGECVPVECIARLEDVMEQQQLHSSNYSYIPLWARMRILSSLYVSICQLSGNISKATEANVGDMFGVDFKGGDADPIVRCDTAHALAASGHDLRFVEHTAAVGLAHRNYQLEVQTRASMNQLSKTLSVSRPTRSDLATSSPVRLDSIFDEPASAQRSSGVAKVVRQYSSTVRSPRGVVRSGSAAVEFDSVGGAVANGELGRMLGMRNWTLVTASLGVACGADSPRIRADSNPAESVVSENEPIGSALLDFDSIILTRIGGFPSLASRGATAESVQTDGDESIDQPFQVQIRLDCNQMRRILADWHDVADQGRKTALLDSLSDQEPDDVGSVTGGRRATRSRKEAKEPRSTSTAEREAWWKKRRAFDDRVDLLAGHTEARLLGPWLGLVHGIPSNICRDDDGVEAWRAAVDQVASFLCDKVNAYQKGSTGRTSALEMVDPAAISSTLIAQTAECALLGCQWMNVDDCSALLEFVGLDETDATSESTSFFQLLNNMWSRVTSSAQITPAPVSTSSSRRSGRNQKNKPMSSAKLQTSSSRPACSSADRGAVLLVVDGALQRVAWECFPVLRGAPVSRPPSVSFVWDQLRAAVNSGSPDGPFNPTPPGQTYFVLDPDGNLPKTQDRFHDYVLERTDWPESVRWTGLVGRAPPSDVVLRCLQTYSYYVFLGHNAGEKHVPAADVASLGGAGRARCLLFGCSSGRLRDEGRFGADGTVMSYLAAGAPSVVGNLWDVTDGDCDKFARALMDDLFRRDEGIAIMSEFDPQPSLAQAVARARNACTLQFAVGAAPVCYGLP